MSGQSTTYAVRQVFYAGVGGITAVLCAAGGVAFWGIWSSYALFVFSAVGVSYVVWNTGLTYVLDEVGLTRSTRWGTQRLVHWSDVSKLKYFERGMTLVLLRRDGSRLNIQCGELPDAEAFISDMDRRVDNHGGFGL
jgi:hypothetical protein